MSPDEFFSVMMACFVGSIGAIFVSLLIAKFVKDVLE
jgi:hypothetical protein